MSTKRPSYIVSETGASVLELGARRGRLGPGAGSAVEDSALCHRINNISIPHPFQHSNEQTEAQYLMTMTIPPCFSLNVPPPSDLNKRSQLDRIHLHPLIDPLGSISQFLQLRYKIVP